MTLTFRDTLAQIVPPWLRNGTAARVLYSMGVQVDAMADAAVAAVKHRFPGLYSFEALSLVGRERRIRRGRQELDESYAVRLRRWLDDHRLRGGAYALLEQLFAHYHPSNFQIDLLYYPSALLEGRARRFTLDIDGNITRGTIDWMPDYDAARWSRWWLFFAWPTAIGDDGTWADAGEWDPSEDFVAGVWDSDLTVADAEDIRLVPKDWIAAHCFGAVVLVGPGMALWDFPPGIWDEPDAEWSDSYPGGTATLDVG